MLRRIYRFLSSKYQTVFLDYRVLFTPRYGHGKPPHAGLLEIIKKNDEIYSSLIETCLSYKEKLQLIQKSDVETDGSKIAWNNGFLPGLDIAMLYTMIAKYQPETYIEVGSGNSTKVAFKAKSELSAQTKIVSIDPYPRAEIDHLADEIIRSPFETIDYSKILALGENDILFIDNSHRILPNSDAMVFFLEILPQLKKGVIVHIHDIYLPYDYPQFMCDRAYSEQYGLAFYLLANPEKYKTIMPNYYVSENPSLSNELLPLWNHANLEGVERHGGSYWIQIQ